MMTYGAHDQQRGGENEEVRGDELDIPALACSIIICRLVSYSLNLQEEGLKPYMPLKREKKLPVM